MLKHPLYGLVLLFLFSLQQVHGQEFILDSAFRYEAYDFNVKQFDDFTDRFNFQKDHMGLSIVPGNYEGPPRQSMIVSLFNHDDPRMLRDSESYSPEYEALIRAFVHEVCRDTLCIDKNSEKLLAHAACRGKLRDREVSYTVVLAQERVGKDMIKWVIRDVKADFLNFLAEDSTMLRFLPPSSGELDFRELQRAFKDLDHLQYYAHKNYRYEALSVFFYLLNSGDLLPESIQEVKYRVYDIPGWCLELKDFNRLSKNSGWLIGDLRKL